MYTDKQEAIDLAQDLRDNGSPSFGAKAERLWELLSRSDVFNGQEASRLYKRAGYIPFEGYPLKRNTYKYGF